jgi:hypothetical protein
VNQGIIVSWQSCSGACCVTESCSNSLLRAVEHSSAPWLTVIHLLLMLQGSHLRKYGRRGKPKIHYFRLSDDDQQLLWDSNNVSRKAAEAAWPDR